MTTMADHTDDEYYVPLVDQRVFGAGIKRKRVAFVPAENDESPITSTAKQSNAGSRYLSIVMKAPSADTGTTAESAQSQLEVQESPSTCEICGQAVSEGSGLLNSHETSIAHQMCLKHSYPPSHLDRSHVGLKYLQDYGWDPDARLGLGARQEGIRIPVKAKQKSDSAGLGLSRNEEEELDKVKQKKKATSKEKQVVKLNAKEIRRIEEEESRRAEKLRRSVYGEDLTQYLGPNG